MLFTLEALQAEAGDSLLLLWGEADSPRVIVVDGGPTRGVYRRLRNRLAALAENREPLLIDLLLVSHIDDDHIDGILHLMRSIDDGEEERFVIQDMWHNAFDDILGNRGHDLQRAAVDSLEAASTGDGGLADTIADQPVQRDTALVLASVRQGRELRDLAERVLGRRPPLQVARADGGPEPFAEGLSLRVVGPLEAQVDALHDTWEEHLQELAATGQLDAAVLASFADSSAANLASIVVLAELEGRSMLLTGDARGDFLVESLEAQGLLEGGSGGRLHVDLFKLPHHGSDRNVKRETFRIVTADHYVVSGDGKHGNPEPETFAMLFGGREDAGLLGRPFTLHLTYAPEDLKSGYPVDELRELFERARRDGHDFEIETPKAEELVRIDLLDPLG